MDSSRCTSGYYRASWAFEAGIAVISISAILDTVSSRTLLPSPVCFISVGDPGFQGLINPNDFSPRCRFNWGRKYLS